MSIRYFDCPHCGTSNAVALCPRDERAFIVTAAHVDDQVREFEAQPVPNLPLSYDAGLCDFCRAKELGNPLASVSAGLRQRTCPECNTEFLASHGL